MGAKEKLYGRAKVTSKNLTRGGEEQKTIWWTPPFSSFRIAHYPTTHPLSLDGIALNSAGKEPGVKLISWGTNNRPYRTFVISAQDELTKEEKLSNLHCKKRSVTFTLQAYRMVEDAVSIYESGLNMEEVCSQLDNQEDKLTSE
jgi:hypothetical protein